MSTQTITTAVNAARAHPELAITARDTMSAIFSRSSTDHAFRVKLISDPSAALAEFAGHQLKGDLKVRFVERQGDATFVLPAMIDPAAELSDTELETVAGGVTPAVAVYVVASSAECVAATLALAAAVCSWFD